MHIEKEVRLVCTLSRIDWRYDAPFWTLCRVYLVSVLTPINTLPIKPHFLFLRSDVALLKVGTEDVFRQGAIFYPKPLSLEWKEKFGCVCQMFCRHPRYELVVQVEFCLWKWPCGCRWLLNWLFHDELHIVKILCFYLQIHIVSVESRLNCFGQVVFSCKTGLFHLYLLQMEAEQLK